MMSNKCKARRIQEQLAEICTLYYLISPLNNCSFNIIKDQCKHLLVAAWVRCLVTVWLSCGFQWCRDVNAHPNCALQNFPSSPLSSCWPLYLPADLPKPLHAPVSGWRLMCFSFCSSVPAQIPSHCWALDLDLSQSSPQPLVPQALLAACPVPAQRCGQGNPQDGTWGVCGPVCPQNLGWLL